MAKVLFIHGGFGNALLQIAHVNKYETSFVISTFFTSKIIRKLFGFTNHPNFLKERVNVKEAGVWGFAMIPVIFFDLFIAKIFKHSLFTEFDIRFVKARPVLKNLAYFGYFQSNIELESVINLGHFLIPYDEESANHNKIVIHVRGGDFIGTSQALDEEYYAKALKYIYTQNIFTDSELVLITNDFDYACEMLKKSGLSREKYSLSSGQELDDFHLLHNCKCLIASKSTFALTAALTKSNNKTILLPKGKFTFKDNFDFSFIYI